MLVVCAYIHFIYLHIYNVGYMLHLMYLMYKSLKTNCTLQITSFIHSTWCVVLIINRLPILTKYLFVLKITNSLNLPIQVTQQAMKFYFLLLGIQVPLRTWHKLNTTQNISDMEFGEGGGGDIDLSMHLHSAVSINGDFAPAL